MAYVFTHGTGTEADPYLVETAADLNGVRDYLSAHFKQAADIDLSGYENWEPIGGYDNYFRGTYDGNGDTIRKLTINRETTNNVGLFGCTFRATLKNINLTNVNIKGNSEVGGLAGRLWSGGNISNCSSVGNISGNDYVGGLVGTIDSADIARNTVYRSFSDGSVLGNNNVGGVAGYIRHTTLTDCYSHSSVHGANCIGGLAGEISDTNITNSYSIGIVSGDNNFGGLIGVIGGIHQCYITESYYDSQASGQSDNRGSPKTTAEMKTQSTYTDWDFADTWGIDPAKNDGYPYLLWQQFEPPPEPFQPWTPPKLEPSWWEGFKLPFNVLELDEDAPIAIQRNFKEIEHYINFLGRTSGEIKDSLELLAAAPAPMSEEEMPDPEPEVPPTDSYFAGYILGKEGQMGSIDAAIKTDSLGGINEVWIARVIDKQGIVEIYNSDAPEHIFRTIAREFNLPLVNLGADVVDVAIEFDGTYDQYNIFVSETEPHIFWVERTGSEDIIYTIKWGGVDPAPIPVELARANLGNMGNGINAGIDPNITV